MLETCRLRLAVSYVCVCVCVHTLTLHTHTSECKAVDLNTIDLKDAFPEQGSGWR